MKRLITLLAAVAILLPASAQTKGGTSVRLNLKMWQYHSVAVDEYDEVWDYNLSATLPHVIGDNDLTALVDTLSSLAYCTYTPGQMPEPAISDRPATESEASSPNHSSITSNVDLEYTSTALLVWKASSYWYPYGAAHGMPSLEYINYAVAKNAILDYSNLFKPGTQDALLKLLRNAMAQPDSGFEEIPTENIVLPNTFKVLPDHIEFCWVGYELGVYAWQGCFTMYIDDLKHLINPEYLYLFEFYD